MEKPKITVEGIDYHQYLKNEETKRRGTEAQQIFTDIICNVAKGALERAMPKIVRSRMPVPQGPAGYVRTLTPDQIRKELGIMAMPYPTILENAIWVIFNKPPKTAREITQELGYELTASKVATVNSALKRFMKKVPAVELVSETGRMPFKFARSRDEKYKDMTLGEVYKLYVETKSPAKSSKGNPYRGKAAFGTTEVTTLTESVVPQELKVTVQISGSIKFLFGFGGEK